MFAGLDPQFVASVCGGALLMAGYALYGVEILRNKDLAPSKVSWGIWSVSGFLAFVSYFFVGADKTPAFLVAPFLNFLAPTIVFAIAWKHCEGGATKRDKICIVLTVLATIYWIVAGAPFEAHLVYLLVDVIGALPTIEKSWRHPHTEPWLAWLVMSASDVMCLSILGHPSQWELAIAALPVYLVVTYGTLFLLVIGLPQAVIRLLFRIKSP